MYTVIDLTTVVGPDKEWIAETCWKFVNGTDNQRVFGKPTKKEQAQAQKIAHLLNKQAGYIS